MKEIKLTPIGVIRSPLKHRSQAPRQGHEHRIKGQIVIWPPYQRALKGLKVGDFVWVICWFHLAKRDVLEVYPRMAPERGLTGVFCSRSPDRPNPIGLELVKIIKINNDGLEVEGLDALDGTPVLDLKIYFANIDCPQDELHLDHSTSPS